MLRPRHHNRLAAWVTLFTLVLAMLAPTVSRAMAFVQGEVAPWGQVCSVSDKLAASNNRAPADAAAHLLDHCPYCSLHSDTGDLPPAPVAVAHAPLPGHALPQLFLQAPRTLHAWASAQARAPPLVC